MARPFLSRCLVIAPLVVACGPGYDPPSVVDSLRVLAVRPEPASGAPGETVTLQMLVTDGTPLAAGEPPRSLEIAWLGGCHNPEAGLYYGCFPTLSAIARELSDRVVDTPPDALPPGTFGTGRSFELTLPDDILSSAPVLPGVPLHFGVSFAFFAACAGELRPAPERTDRVPLACVDPASGRELDEDDFVQGFATVQTFEGARNQNPVLSGVRFGALELVERTCERDEDCAELSAEPGAFACASSGRCGPVVAPCGAEDDGCPRYLVDPEIEPSSAETIAGDAKEILWANFYATDGTFQADAQLVNDRNIGWIHEHGSHFVAPEKPAEAMLFVTVHDERGGATWATFPVLVRN